MIAFIKKWWNKLFLPKKEEKEQDNTNYPLW